jgi:hypothetical protein
MIIMTESFLARVSYTAHYRIFFIFTEKRIVRISSGAFFFDIKIFVVFLLLLPCAVFSQKAKPAGKSSIKPEEKLVLSDSLIFLGIDMSQTRLVSHNNKKTTVDKKGYEEEWAEICGTICKEHNLKYEFSKKKLFCKADLFARSYEKIDSDWVVEAYKGISPEEMTQHIKTYPEYATYGLGFVFVIDKMEGLVSGTVTMYGVYINLSDNSVLKTIKCSGAIEGFGSQKNWADAIDVAYNVFKVSNQDYIHKLKEKFIKKKTKGKNKKKTTKKK